MSGDATLAEDVSAMLDALRELSALFAELEVHAVDGDLADVELLAGEGRREAGRARLLARNVCAALALRGVSGIWQGQVK